MDGHMSSSLNSIKRRSIYIGAGLLFSGLSFFMTGPAVSAGFEAPEPPPELGENLTGYRTRQQILEQAIRAEEARNPPKMKIYRKDGTTEEYVDNNAMMNSGTVVSSGPVSAQPVREHTSAPQQNGCCSRVVKDRFVYDSGKMFRIYDGSELVFRIRDGAEVSWPIAKAECSNNGFKIQLNKKHDSIRIVPTSAKIGMANVRVYLQGRESSPLSFVVSLGSGRKTEMYEWDVLVSYKSPLNTSDDFHGVTNITRSARARTTRRDVDATRNFADTVSEDSSDSVAGADTVNSASATGNMELPEGETAVNPDAGVAAYPINQKNLYAVTVSEEELNTVADRLYEAVE